MARNFILFLAITATTAVSAPERAHSRHAHANPIEAVEAALFPAKAGVNTDAAIVMVDGKVLYETYRRGYDETKRHLSWSMAKTISAILVGQAASDGRLSLDEAMTSFYPHFPTGATVRDVMQMSSGLKFKEEYSGIPVNADVTRMLYMDGPGAGFGNYVAALPAAGTVPAKHYHYSSGDTALLMGALRRRVATQAEYDAWPFERFFAPIGVADAAFEQDAHGEFSGSSYVYLTARDWAKVGQLLVDRGMAGGDRVVPEPFFAEMNRVAPGVQTEVMPGNSTTRAYSMHVTTNLPIEGRGLPSEYGELPRDSLLLIGHQGQLVVASPSARLVLVRLGTDKGGAFERRPFLKAAVDLVRSTGAVVVTAGDEDPRSSATSNGEFRTEGMAGIGDYLRVPHLIRALAAKEYCSCVFVTERSEEDCRADLKVTLPVIPRIRLDRAKGTVRTILGTGLFGKASVAEYRGRRLGCRLVESE